MRKSKEVNIYFLVILLLGIFAGYPLAYLFKFLNITDYRVMLFITHMTLFILPAIIYFIISKKNIKDTLKLNKLHLKDALLLILLAFLCQPMVTFFSLITQLIFPNNVATVIESIIDTPYILFLLLFAVMPAITEEITIRGIILSGYEDENMYSSAIITGLFFGIMHLDGQQFLYAMVLGIILALVVRITKSIFSSMLIHFVINGTSVTLSKLMSLIPASEEEINVANEVAFNSLPSLVIFETILFYGMLAIIFSIAIYYTFKKLISLNINRKIITREEVKLKKNFAKSFKNLANIPVLSIIGIYLIYMAIF